MKRTVGVGLAFLLGISSVSNVVSADTGVSNEEIVEEEVVEFDVIKEITLDMAIDRALNDSASLMLLKYQLDLINSQEAVVAKDYRDIRIDVRDLERDFDDLRGQEGSFQERYAIYNQLDVFGDTLIQLEQAIEQLKTGKVTLQYSEAEARESIKMGTIAAFTQFKMTEDQLDLQKQAVSVKEKEVAAMKRQYELGLVSRDTYNTALRELDIQKSDIEQLEKNTYQEVVEFALDLGIVFTEGFTLVDPDLSDLQLVTQEKTTDELVKNSFQYKSQLEAISLAEFTRDQVYEDDDSDVYEKNEADINVQVEKQKLSQLELRLKESVRQLYYEAEDGYQAVLDAERDLKNAEEDYQKLERRYQVGLVSRVNYENAAISVEQARVAQQKEKKSYFMLTKQIEMVEAGVIQ